MSKRGSEGENPSFKTQDTEGCHFTRGVNKNRRALARKRSSDGYQDVVKGRETGACLPSWERGCGALRQKIHSRSAREMRNDSIKGESSVIYGKRVVQMRGMHRQGCLGCRRDLVDHWGTAHNPFL